MPLVNVDLAAARARASFDVEPMTHFLHGGAVRTMQRRQFLAMLGDDPLFDVTNDIFEDRVACYQKAILRARRLKELQSSLGLEKDAVGWRTLRECAAFDDPTALHELMFIPNIEALCTEEQASTWLPPSRSWEVLGCYAQTEVGHGSNVRALETTATYLPESDEFEVHTPGITAIKFWPGSLGRTANTAMVRNSRNGYDIDEDTQLVSPVLTGLVLS
jgi:acyl-CoA oxidase